LLKIFFYADDFLLIYQITNWSPAEFIFSPMGEHVCITRNLIFLLMYKAFGFRPFLFFATVLITHLISVYLLFKVILYLTHNNIASAMGATVWGISPINFTTLAWYSVYGHIIIAPFFLLFLLDLFRLKDNKISFSIIMALKWSVYLFIIATSFGVGLGLVCISPVVILILFWNDMRKWKIALSLMPVITVIIVLFIFNNNIYLIISGEKKELLS